jgi:hypothetical protein
MSRGDSGCNIDNQLGAWGMKRSISTLVAAVVCAGIFAGAAVARTAESSATQLCSKVSASSVSSVIGYKVPAAAGTTLAAKATKTNDFISGSTLICSFGSDTSMAALKKTVELSYETVSKTLSAAELKVLFAKTSTLAKGLKVKFSAYPALGGESFLMSFSEAGISVESLVAANGTKLYSATVYGDLATSKLANLVKLAEKL